MDKTTGKTQYTVYAKLGDALKAAKATNTVSLMSDVTAGEVVVPANVTLNLYGRTLTANEVSATFEGAQIKDEKSSKTAGGKLITESLAVSEDNAFVSFFYDGAYHFDKAPVKELLVDNVYKFYVEEEADATLLDDLLGTDGTGVKMEIVVEYTKNGTPTEKVFEIDPALAQQYANGWDTKMITLTFPNLDGVTALECHARIVAATENA